MLGTRLNLHVDQYEDEVLFGTTIFFGVLPTLQSFVVRAKCGEERLLVRNFVRSIRPREIVQVSAQDQNGMTKCINLLIPIRRTLSTITCKGLAF